MSPSSTQRPIDANRLDHPTPPATAGVVAESAVSAASHEGAGLRTLFIAPQVPHPLDAGSKIRIHHLLRAYAQLGPVTLLCYAQDDQERASTQALASLCDKVVCVPFTPAPPRRLLGSELLGRFASVRPAMVRAFTSPAFTAALDGTRASGAFDIVHISRLSMTFTVPRLVQIGAERRPHVVVDVDDLESNKLRRLISLHGLTTPARWLHTTEYVKLRAYESRALRQVDSALVCSDADQHALHARGFGLDVAVFANGADLPATSDGHADGCGPVDDGLTLLYLGAMGYAPNQDAVLYFVREILPLIKRQIPGVRLEIAGKEPGEAVRALDDRQSGIHVVGYVSDKQEALDRCTVFIVPLRLGGGTRIKILEAMAAAKPVVSTTVGCEGLAVEPGTNILVGDRPADFADACVGLLRDPARRRAVSQAGRQFVESHSSWAAIRSRYIEHLAGRLGPGNAAAPRSAHTPTA